jgi:hypothetical protein
MKWTMVLPHAPAPLMDALLEHTCELAGALPHVESARLLERRCLPDGRVFTRQHWRARAQVPDLLRPHLEDGLHDWTMSFEWRTGEPTVQWHARCAAVQVPGRCSGSLHIAPALGGCGTRIEVHCEVPSTNEALRTIFGALLQRHWRALAEAAAARARTTNGEIQ